MNMKRLAVIGIDFHSASQQSRADFHLTGSQIEDIYEQCLVPRSVMILSTCNRTEFYFPDQEDITDGFKLIEAIFRKKINQKEFYSYTHDQALVHLLELTTGLKSMIIGETEILGQFRNACRLRDKHDFENGFWQTLGETVINFARRIRRQTNIGGYSSSLYTLVIRELKNHLKNLDQQKALILGNGEIGQHLAQAFVYQGIATSMLARGNGLKRRFKPQKTLDEVELIFGYEHLEQLLAAHEIIVAATAAPHYIIKPEHNALVRGKILIDLSFPRNIDPELGINPGCLIWDLEFFGQLTYQNKQLKAEAFFAAKKYCKETAAKLLLKQESGYLKEDSIA